MSNYHIDDGRLQLLAENVLLLTPKLQHLADDCTIAFQWCSKDKTKNGKTVFADTHKVSDKVKAFVGFDYIMTFYPIAQELNKIGLERLMKHELLHIRTDGEKFGLNPHDCEDFREMIEAYGFDWAQSQLKMDQSQEPMEVAEDE